MIRKCKCHEILRSPAMSRGTFSDVHESRVESPLSEEVLSCARIKPVKASGGPPDYRTVRQR